MLQARRECPVEAKGFGANDKLFEAQTAMPNGIAGRAKGLGLPPQDARSPASLTGQRHRAPIAAYRARSELGTMTAVGKLSAARFPQYWDRPVMLVVPVSYTNAKVPEVLGPWLAANVNFNRNMVRFLLQKPDLPRLFDDKELSITARCATPAKDWKDSESKYGNSGRKQFDRELRKDCEVLPFRPFLPRDSGELELPEPNGVRLPHRGAWRVGKRYPRRRRAAHQGQPLCPRGLRAVHRRLRQPKRNDETGPPPARLLPWTRTRFPTSETAAPTSRSCGLQPVIALRSTSMARGFCAAGQSDDEALRFFKQRAYPTGKDLHDVQLGDASKVGSTGLCNDAHCCRHAFPAAHQCRDHAARWAWRFDDAHGGAHPWWDSRQQ